MSQSTSIRRSYSLTTWCATLLTHVSGTPRTRSLTRATQLLQAIAERPAGSSASELARATDQPRATISRTLRTLEDAGLVEETGEATWVLGYELVRLARSADPNRGFVEAARPAARRIAGRDGRVGERGRAAGSHGHGDRAAARRRAPRRRRQLGRSRRAAARLVRRQGRARRARRDRARSLARRRRPAHRFHGEGHFTTRSPSRRSSHASGVRAGPSSSTSSRTASRPCPFRCARRRTC